MQTEKLSAVDRLICATITGILVFSVLSGTALPALPFYAAEMVIFSLLLLWLTDRLIFLKKPELKWVALPPVVLLIIFLFFTGMQMVPLPGELVRLISPHIFADKIQAADLLARAHDLPLPDKGWMTTTAYLYPARSEWLKSAACLVMFFLIIHTIKSARQIKILAMVMLLAALPAAVGMVCQADWIWKSAGRELAGLNYFADYMAILLLLVLGYLIAARKKSRRLMSGLQGRRAGIQKIIGLFSPEMAGPQRIFFFFCAGAIGTALMFTGSRPGLLSLALVLTLVGVLFFFKSGFRSYGWIAMLVGLAVLAAWSFGKNLSDEKKQSPGCNLLISMIGDYAVAGIGPGNFKYIYPGYGGCDSKNNSCNIGRPFLKAVVEYGMGCSILVLCAFGTLLYRLLRIWFRRKNDALATGIGAVAVGCMLLTGVYAFFGPGMWAGYNCFLVTAIPALGYCALFRQGYGFSEKFFWKTGSLKLTRWRRALLLLSAVTGWMLMINLVVSDHKELQCKNEYRLKERQVCNSESDKNAMFDLEKTLRDNPGWGKNWYFLGKCYALQKEDAYQYLNKWLPLAEQCFEQGLKRLPCDAGMLFDVAGYWVWRSGTLADDGSHGKGIEKFQKLFKRSLAITPENWQAAAAVVWQYFPQDAVVMGIIPEDDALQSRMLRWVTLKRG